MFMRFIIAGIIAGKGNNKGFSLMGVVVSIIVVSIMAVMSMPALIKGRYSRTGQITSPYLQIRL